MRARSVSTSVTLLERLRERTDEDAWSRFVLLYTPLILQWARRVGCSGQQAEELLQEVFLVLLDKLATFEHRAGGCFRGWLQQVTRNKWRELQRHKWRTFLLPDDELEAVAAPPDGDPFEEREFAELVSRRMLDLMATDFTHSTWRAFEQYVIKGRPAREVAHELGVSPDVVYSAKFRILQRLRAELAGQID